MTDDIDPGLRRLIDAHPALFRGRPPVVPSFVTQGWYELIDKLCSDIEALLGPEGCERFEVQQVKEKYGALRFYYRFAHREDVHIDLMSSAGRTHLVRRAPLSGDSDTNGTEARLRELVAAACAASEAACESCGAPAQLRNLGGYLTTLCDRHMAETMARRGEQA